MTDWQNRIVDKGFEGPEELKAHPNNWRIHSDDQRAALESLLTDVGWVREVLVNRTTGNIIDGHLRVASAIADGQTVVPVSYLEVTAEEEELILATLDPVAAMAGTGKEKLAALMANLTIPTDALRKKLEEMAVHAKAGAQDADTVPDLRDTSIERGDIYQLGAHRLMCGDSTASEDVSALLEGATPFLCVTDPPYGVNYNPAWRNEEAKKGNLGYHAQRVGKVKNDDRADWREAWQLTPSDVIYSWHPAPPGPCLIHGEALEFAGFCLRNQIIWAKSNFPIGRGDYHARHEPCWYAVRKGKAAKRTKDRTQTTLWQINLDKNVVGGHSTQKPVECMRKPIENHHCEEVYEPFSGSGTTLIAAQQLGRKCYAMELEPEYCQVAIDRWEAFTKDKAVKL